MTRPLLTVLWCLMAAAAATAAPPIELDGEFDDWPAGVRLLGDERYVYLRLATPEEVVLDSAPWEIAIHLDIDGDPETGVQGDVNGTDFGDDVVFRFTPWNAARAKFDEGVSAITFEDLSVDTVRPGRSLGLAWAPRHASREFEIRIDRTLGEYDGEITGRLMALIIATAGGDRPVVWKSDLLRSELPPIDRSPQAVDLDGRFDEWPASARALADDRFIYLRLATPETVTLQQAPWTISVLIDADASADTGARLAWDDSGLGAELRLDMSPPFEGAVGNGVGAARLTGAGETRLDDATGAFAWAPTHASDAFEIRIDRRALALDGPVALRIGAFDAAGAPAWTLDPVRLDLPALAGEPLRVDLEIPAKPAGAVRVLSWNVLWGSPMANTEPFDRVLGALDPDVILVQEWDDRNRDAPPVDEEELAKWFNYHEDTPIWSVVKGAERGVAIVSRHPLERIETRTLRPIADGDSRVREDNGIRFAAARVRTPAGDMIAASLHLKCCGGYGGEEDAQRLAEARAIREAIRAATRAGKAPMVVVAGDYNLVGDPAPLAMIASGTDSDASDLVAADTRNLGQPVRFTWSESGSRFAPGRLDYALVGDASARIVNAFIFDASALSDATLAAIAVERGDTAVSDHMPLVIDILPASN